MLSKFIIALASLATAVAQPGSNYNVSKEFAVENGCGDACQQNMGKANKEDIDTFGHNFDFSFYETTSNFSTASAGDMLKIQPVDPKPLQIRAGTSVFRIQYASKDLDGSLVPATGFLALPYTGSPAACTKPHTYPLVAYAHGTSGIYRGCSPSSGPNFYDYNSWQLLVDRGYAVVATDYAGLGNNYTLHKYCSFKAQINDVYFSVAAVQKAFDIFSKNWLAVGHSQGGGTVWKLSESDLIKNDKHYLGTVALAPAARLWDMFKENLKTPGAFLGYAAYHAKALQRVMPSYNLTVLGDTLLKRMAIADEAQLCFSGLMSMSADLKNDQIVSYEGIKKDNEKFEAWQKEMAPAESGSLSSRPVLVIQGTNDTSVLADVTRKVAKQACKQGSEVHLSEYPGMEHSPVIAAAAAEWLAWVDGRFKREKTPGKCSMQTQHAYDMSLVKAPSEE